MRKRYLLLFAVPILAVFGINKASNSNRPVDFITPTPVVSEQSSTGEYDTTPDLEE